MKAWADRNRCADDIAAQLNFHLDRLAEGEHDGWMNQRIADGWTKANARNYLQREHEMLVPYNCLPRENKKKNESAVLSMWRRLDEQDYQIVWLTAAPSA